MESHFEINVTRNGYHLFATAPRSVVSAHEAKILTLVIRQRFPKSEGFAVTCTHWTVTGDRVTF